MSGFRLFLTCFIHSGIEFSNYAIYSCSIVVQPTKPVANQLNVNSINMCGLVKNNAICIFQENPTYYMFSLVRFGSIVQCNSKYKILLNQRERSHVYINRQPTHVFTFLHGIKIRWCITFLFCKEISLLNYSIRMLMLMLNIAI